MPSLTQATWNRIRELFAPENHLTVAELLENECGSNLPFQEHADASALEKFHMAALKLSQGSLDQLREAVQLAKTDWRDLLVAASDMDTPNENKWWHIRRRPRRPKP